MAAQNCQQSRAQLLRPVLGGRQASAATRLLSSFPSRDEGKEQPERVAIAPYGCRAQTLLSLQVLFEERIDNRPDGGHGVAPVDKALRFPV